MLLMAWGLIWIKVEAPSLRTWGHSMFRKTTRRITLYKFLFQNALVCKFLKAVPPCLSSWWDCWQGGQWILCGQYNPGLIEGLITAEFCPVTLAAPRQLVLSVHLSSRWHAHSAAGGGMFLNARLSNNRALVKALGTATAAALFPALRTKATLFGCRCHGVEEFFFFFFWENIRMDFNPPPFFKPVV